MEPNCDIFSIQAKLTSEFEVEAELPIWVSAILREFT
jgi:hypothetical protein